MTTRTIDVSAHNDGATTLELGFDSSWRPEGSQLAIIWTSFDGATPLPQEVWDSSGGFFKPDAINEAFNTRFGVPPGARNLEITFSMNNAANNWWWAIDNLELSVGDAAPFWTEDFESLTLGPSVNERQGASLVTAANDDENSEPRPEAFTHEAPGGWSVDNSGLAVTVGDDNVGVFEWEGWSFAKNEFWASVDGQLRDEFTKGSGNVAVADSDEWKDLGSAAGDLDTVLASPNIRLAGVEPGTAKLQFDSSWRDEGSQAAVITVDFGNGEQEVLRWESDAASPNFHDDATNETVVVDLSNPAGAEAAKLRFKLVDSDNNWWWAIDNISVVGVLDSLPGDFTGDDVVDERDLNDPVDGFVARFGADLNGADLLSWQQFLGTTLPAASTVPEPAGVVAAAVALTLLWVCGRNSSQGLRILSEK